jgi:hypothetical protein
VPLPSDVFASKWEITKKAEDSNRVLLIREKMDRKRLAVRKNYENNNNQDYSKELQALKILKGKNKSPKSLLKQYSASFRCR